LKEPKKMVGNGSEWSKLGPKFHFLCNRVKE